MYDDKEITLADIPGLIEGAHKGTGLGIKFLKHIERCKVLLHLIDISESDLSIHIFKLEMKWKNIAQNLLKKQEIIVFNKIDLIDDNEKNKKIKDFEKITKKPTFRTSTLDKKSVSDIKSKLLNYVS